MHGKVHLAAEKKFQESLVSWGDDVDNRPFIRVRIDEDMDQIAYVKKWERIRNEQKRISKITGDPVENINLFDAWGKEYSRAGNLRDFD